MASSQPVTGPQPRLRVPRRLRRLRPRSKRLFPTSIAAIATFVALLAPGFVYVSRLERRRASQTYSALRETTTIVLVSLVANAAAFCAFGLARLMWQISHSTSEDLSEKAGASCTTD